MTTRTQPLRDEHKELIPHIELLRTVADSVGEVPIESLRQGVDEVYTFLIHHLIPHAQAEDRALYPVVGKVTTAELEALSAEVRRVLKAGRLNIYTVRTTNDIHYGTGIHRGEDMYEVGGFIVHFFNREQIERLAKGFTILAVDELEEGTLPRKLIK